MPYDPGLAERIRSALEDVSGVTEKAMFGGIGWMIGGHLAAGAHSDGRLMIRCTREDHPSLMAEPGADAIRRGGKPMSGWLLIDGDAVSEDDDLARWIARGRAYAQSLPPKS